MKIKSKSLTELEEKLSLLLFLKERQDIVLEVKGNPALESFRDGLMKKTKPFPYTYSSPYSKIFVSGNIISYSKILDVESVFRVKMPVYGFFYLVEEDCFIFEENPLQASGVRRALDFVRLLKVIRKDGK